MGHSARKKQSTIEQVADAGFGPVENATENTLIPGATLGVVTAAGERAVRYSGHAALQPRTEALTRSHWFDLASLTKVIATSTIILKLVDDGLIELDGLLTHVIPDLRQCDVANAVERRLTFRSCLAHRTFLPATFPLYTYDNDPARLREFLLQCVWIPGPQVYSDINFMLLGIAIERVTGCELSDWPLGGELCYGTPSGPTVSTEMCHWRGRILKGEVHDENCFALGGQAGHAGLFGTVDGVLKFAAGLLNGTGVSESALAAMREQRWLGKSAQ